VSWQRCAGAVLALPHTQGQGCLHKAAQRGHAAVCAWLLSPEESGGVPGGSILAPGKPTGRRHCTGNLHEGARPSDLARCGGHEALALALLEAEDAWLGADQAQRM